MSYNIKGHGSLFRDRHLEEIALVIREAKPDVVGIQELHRRTLRARYRDQLAELESNTGMRACFGRSLLRKSGEYGNAILVRGEITESEVLPLPGKGEPRTVLRAALQLGGLAIDVFVTHLVAWGRLERRTRALQAAAVASITERAKRPFVLMGDFNTTPKSEELAAFHDGKLVSSCFPAGAITHRATRQCLDSIFADPRWEVVASRVVDAGPSDHWPLVADLRLNAPLSS